jgi:hypothetical protein
MSGHILQPAVGEPEAQPRRLSADFQGILDEARGRTMTLGELEEILKGRGFALFLLILSLPFAFPIPIPGLSTPFGLVIMILGLRIAFGMKPGLPAFILRRQIPFHILQKTIGFGIKVSLRMEKYIRPRMHFLRRWPGMINLIGLGIASSGFVLLLPMPLPFSNTVPALAIVLLSAGLMERDGLLVLIGHLLNIAGWAYVIIASTAAGEGAFKLWEHFGRH